MVHNDDAHYEDDSDYPYCAECFAKLQECAIKSYNYKPEPIFYGSGNFFMGVELEIDKGGENDENAQVLLDVANRYKEHIYCKHDGKKAGREYIHFVVSFKGKQDADIVYGIAERICMLYADYQVLFSVHLNTRNTHIHFVLNTVSVKDGHKYSQSKADMQNLKKCIESIINQSGLLYEEIYESDYYDDEEDDFEYPDESELIDPIIPLEESELIDPIIPLDKSELIDLVIPRDESGRIDPRIPLNESELIDPIVPLRNDNAQN